MHHAPALMLLLSAVSLGATPSLAQPYPSKPVRVIVPWPPGGSNDVAARVVMEKMSELTGQRFLVDNRPGASGTVGADTVAKSRPDGYTLMVHSTTHVANGSLYKSLPYDTLNDFVAVGTLSSQPGVLVVHPSLPPRSVREFIALAKRRPGTINFSTSGNGSASHMSMALFMEMAGINVVHIPFKGGAPQVVALVSGETQTSLATIAEVLSFINSGRLIPLGVSSTKPSPALPGVPPIASAGVPGFEMNPWIALFAPAGTPKALVDRLSAGVNEALKDPGVKQQLNARALDPLVSTPEEFAVKEKADFEKYARLIKLTGAKLD